MEKDPDIEEKMVDGHTVLTVHKPCKQMTKYLQDFKFLI